MRAGKLCSNIAWIQQEKETKRNEKKITLMRKKRRHD